MRSPGKDNLSDSNIQMNTNEYMLFLHKRLLEKTYGDPPRHLGESTASAYIKTLYILNGKKPFKNLAFIKKTGDIMNRISEYAESTQKTIVATIASVLSLDKDKAGYKKTYKFYYEKMKEKAEKANAVDTSEKTATQKENWIEWADVLTKYEEMKKVLTINKPSFEDLLKLVLLALYTEVPPRRNQDYLQMVVLRTTKRTKIAELPVDKNYLILGVGDVPKEFIFNVYKTAKKYGKQTVAIPEALAHIIKLYLKHHPNADKKEKRKEFPFLITAEATPITADNAITRILNRIFGKKVGSSMLRHSYLSSKYNISGMTEDAENMGHSLNEQKKYMKAPHTEGTLATSSDTPEVPPPSPPTHS